MGNGHRMCLRRGSLTRPDKRSIRGHRPINGTIVRLFAGGMPSSPPAVDEHLSLINATSSTAINHELVSEAPRVHTWTVASSTSNSAFLIVSLLR